MSTEFIHDQVWKRLRRAARQCRRPASVAVAYFGKGAAKLLPLKKGSRLVVDASEGTIKCGLTHPRDLLELQAKGVRIYSVQNLHAKAYVFGKQAFIGSPNVSHSSATKLMETLVRVTDREVVKAARAFVRGLCLQELGPEELTRLQKLYRSPKSQAAAQRKPSKRNGRVRPQFAGLRVAKLVYGDYPRGSERVYEEGYEQAKSKRKHIRSHILDEFRWANGSMRRGESVMQIVDEGNGDTFVVPPGEIINTRKWSNGRQECTFIYLEIPRRRRLRMKQLAKRIGPTAAKKLRRSGRVASDLADKLREVWRQ